MTETTEPVRKGLLPCARPPEFEFHTVFGARTGSAGCALFPGDAGPVVVRRRVTYGDWEPVRPNHWADEPAGDAAAAPAAAPSGPAVWIDGHPQLEVIAAAVWERCGRHSGGGSGLTVDDPRNIAVAALAALSSAPADRAALRDRIAKALYAHDHPGWTTPLREYDGEPVYQERAAAVLAVLSETADRAAVLREAADVAECVAIKRHEQHEIEREQGALDVMTQLRRMADETQQQGASGSLELPDPTFKETAETLNLADEAQQPETQAPYPPSTSWTIQTHRRGTWHRWHGDRDTLDEAREDYERNVARNGHQWAFRVVRSDITFAVEVEHQPAAVSQPDREA